MAKSFVVNAVGSDFRKNAIVDDKDVLIKILDWDFKKDDDETIVLDVIVLTGLRKGAELKDFVSFAKTSKMNWKYAALRDAIGEPIPERGEDSFDLINLCSRFILIDLIKSKDGKFQNINYVRYNEKVIEPMVEAYQKELDAKPKVASVKVEQIKEVPAPVPAKPTPGKPIPANIPTNQGIKAGKPTEEEGLTLPDADEDLPF